MTNKHEKFMFNMHNFDDPEEVEEIIEEEKPPPPPTFTQEELAAAKSSAFEEGKRAGLTEAQSSLEKQVLDVVNAIQQEIPPLFSNEDQREAQFQNDLIALFDSIMAQLLPSFMAQHGLEELKIAISNIFKDIHAQKNLIIYVHETVLEPVKKHLSEENTPQQTTQINVQSHSDLGIHECKMEWDNGGASFNLEDLAQKIVQEIQGKLAQPSSNSHDEQITQGKTDHE